MIVTNKQKTMKMTPPLESNKTKTEKYRLTSRKCQNYNRYVADINNSMKSFEEIYNDQLRDLEITVNCGFIVSKHLLKQ